MKPSEPTPSYTAPSSDDSELEDSEATPTEVPPRPTLVPSGPSTRPPLVRSPPERLSEINQNASPDDVPTNSRDASSSSDDAIAGQTRPAGRPGAVNRQSSSKTKSPATQPTLNADLATLKDAVNAKMMHQYRVRGSPGGSGAGVGVGAGATKRVPSFKGGAGLSGEVTGVSSMAAVLGGSDEPIRTTSTTTSAESNSSQRTVRGSASIVPGGGNAPRTPSYPFPYIPGTPRSWATSFHQPFTNLSPTVPSQFGYRPRSPGDNGPDMYSVGSTPAASSSFLPQGVAPPSYEDPRFPTPSVYDLVLELNSEPGLEQWWTTVTNIAHDYFKAERATLVMPQDPTDLENVPWGQKATFSMNGPEEFVSHRTVAEQTAQSTLQPELQRPEFVLREPSTETAADVRPQRLHPERLRPRLESRHSYAGHTREVRDILTTVNESGITSNPRPPAPQRHATHAPGTPAGPLPSRFPPRRLPSGMSIHPTSASDLDFSTVAGSGVDAGPYAEIFPTLRVLDQESRPLLEPAGISRILDRARVVVVTRDYVTPDTAPTTAAETPQPPSSLNNAFGDYRRVFTSSNSTALRRDYEEYEQHPTSPWAQSPAPSPAIQPDEDENPFFASEEQQVEDSFNPAASPKDYSQMTQVEAIGVDNASTVIHIPLVHPTLSQPMQSSRMTPHPKDHPTAQLRRSNTIDLNKKAPIAILSILTSTVPYPHNLISALKHLGPHLATSFATAQQFSSVHSQSLTIRHRRTASGHNMDLAPMILAPASLEEIANAELEDLPASMSGSITSPSDYSGRSRHSPSGSIVGTPGWDPATHGWPGNRSVTSTPAIAASEMVDNYFEAKKRTRHRSSSNTSTTAHNLPARSSTRTSSSNDSKTNLVSPDDANTPKGERKVKPSPSSVDDISSSQASQITDISTQQRPNTRHLPLQAGDFGHVRPHSVLHSYGADFQSSFGLASAPVSEPRTPGIGAHARKNSYPEDMPPPSERLLRTIIDSVPVQIFTAQPETGHLSWVNSKFLIYRGLEPRQVLNDPWQAIHPEDRNDFMPAWHRSLRTNQQLQQKVRLQRYDGCYRWFYVRAAPLKDKRQKIVHWIGTMMDFHEQHIAEVNSARQQETAASEAKYRALANSSPQIVFAVGRSKGITFCNSQWLHYSGQSEVQALGVGFMDHVHPDDLVKCRLPTFDDVSGLPNNVPTSVPSELRRSQSASIQSSSGSSETERAMSTSDMPISSPPPLPQRKLSELASTGILKVTKDADGRPSYSTEVRLKAKDGGYRWHLVRVLLAEPLLQNGSNEETWYGTSTDINDHKTLERDLKETMDEKSRFLSNMSHEIRTPLNGITGMVNFLIDSNLTAEQMEHVNIIRASTEGLRGLINDILDLSKAEAGMIQLNYEWAYVRALIEEVNDLTSSMAIGKGLELNYLVEEDVPIQIKGDRFRIRQILLNIVGNAIKFTTKGEVFVRCSVQSDPDHELAAHERFLRFEIVDTGRGFTDKEAEYLFKRFSQIDGSSTRQHGGTGLGLVISRQLAQLHGGDMSARGVPDKGSTFTFYVKTAIPSKRDRPPPPATPGLAIPDVPISPGTIPISAVVPAFGRSHIIPPTPTEPLPRASPKFTSDVSHSPSSFVPAPDPDRESPSVSSVGSDPSLRSATQSSSLRSERSSASSFNPEQTIPSAPMKLTMPVEVRPNGVATPPILTSTTSTTSSSTDSTHTARPSNLTPTTGTVSPPPMFSILVVAPLKYSREATVQHIDKTLPNNIPHQITARDSLAESKVMLGGNNPVRFTHVVAVLQDVGDIIALLDLIMSTTPTTSIVLITDLAQRKKIMEQAPHHNYDRLVADHRLQFVFKPLKPSRFGLIFDPQKEREMSLDRNQDSAQQVAVNQKQVFDELTRRLGHKKHRVLLVEDNPVNQMVIHKFLAKVSITAETVMDGVQCTEKVFAQPLGYYSIILCDLHMPNKDGYQTCKEIRRWERKHGHSHLPIIALSANVLGDVYQKCVDAGFNSYMTKPVDFKELSSVLMTFMDPDDPSKPHELMKMRRGSVKPGR